MDKAALHIGAVAFIHRFGSSLNEHVHSADIRQILDHIGVQSQPPHISPARGPPLWEDCDAQMDDGVQIEPDWHSAAQPAPDYEVDQRVNG